MPLKDPEERKIYNRDSMRRWREKKKKIKNQNRKERIANRNIYSSKELSWAAGVFEGEGTATLTKGGRIMHVRPLVSITSTDKEMVLFFKERWNGYLRKWKPISAKSNFAYTWALNSGEAICCFLLDIVPHLITSRVRTKVLIVLEDIEERFEHPRDILVKQRSEERRIKINQLNKRGL